MKLLKNYTMQFLLKTSVLLLTIFALVSCENEDSNTQPLTEVIAPDFTLLSLDGRSEMLSAYKGSVVVLFFFGNNCPSCKAAAPNIESMLVTPFAIRSDYQLLGLDQWNGNSASVEAFKNLTGVSFPLLLNAAGIAAEYKTTYDRLVVIDKQGKIVFSGTQGAAADIEAVKQKVESLLGEDIDDNDTTTVSNGNAPQFTLFELSGAEISLSDYSGKVVVLFFLGYNCSSCKSAAPSIQGSLVDDYASRSDYQLLGLDQWNGNSNSVQAFKTSTGVSFPLLMNASPVASEYGTSYDRLIVIDKNGDIAFKGTQLASSDIDVVKEKVDLLLAP